MNHAYEIVNHFTQNDGRIMTHVETNDDDDDGYPDGKITQFTLGPWEKYQALRSPRDRSHIGASGVHVYVYLDGEELT
jgi:hypothetical protein